MEVEINGNRYQTGRLTPFQQFHVSRRLAPVLMALGAAAGTFLRGLKEQDLPPDFDVDSIGPIADAVAALSDADSEYVLNTCLGVCARQEATGWQRIMPRPGVFQYQDMDLPTMLRLTFSVIKDNMGNFTPAPPIP